METTNIISLSVNRALGGPRAVLAVDPGLSGAAALLGHGLFSVERDFKAIEDIPRALRRLTDRWKPDHLVIEQVGAMPGQGVCSMFSFGKSTGTAFGSLWTLHPGQTVEEVHPIRWQNFYRKLFGIIKGTPFDSRAVAARLFHDHLDLFTRKKDHNTADAVLIALWKLLQ